MELKQIEDKQLALSDGDSGTMKISQHSDEEQWKAGKPELTILATLSIISFIIAVWRFYFIHNMPLQWTNLLISH